MTEKERRIKAKIPGEETGIEIKRTMCDICTPGPHCGIDAYVKDGVVIKVEGTKGFPGSNGRLCTKGAASRQYIYREDRLKNPMKRVGKRGDGAFEEISWDEALDITARRLLALKEKYGAESVAWLTGYSKWYRPWLHRLAHSFGSLNYVSESSACHVAEVMSFKSLFGQFMIPDMRHVKTVFCWGSNAFANAFLRGSGLFGLKERGGTIVSIDPRITHTAQKVSDLYLRPKIGTDGVLANAMARRIIELGGADEAFIQRYVYGYEAYREMVFHYSMEDAARITGVPENDIERAVELFLAEKETAIMPGNGLTHRINGFQIHRAILSLMAITGRVDKPGTYIPGNETICHSDGGFPSHEEEFYNSVKPKDTLPAIGSRRFPIWNEMVDEGQGMDFTRQVLTGEPYPLKGAACFGVNHMMYPQSSHFLKALDSMDFVMATDIFETEVVKHADIVLPVGTSFERSEVKCYGGRFVNYTTPVIAPVYDNKDDVWIIAELARRMHLGDTLLEQGYDAGVAFMLQESGITDWEMVKNAPLPVPAPNARPYQIGSFLEHPLTTPTGKIELYSQVVAGYEERGLNPLPEAECPLGDMDPVQYPFVLMSGARIPTAIHTRMAKSSWLRSLSPEPSLEMNPVDADKLKVKTGDMVRIITKAAQITVPVRVNEVFAPGEVGMFHGYKEANVNELIPMDHLDPYSGFPGYKQFRCSIERV